MVMPFPAPTDTIGRVVAEGMRASLGQPVVIDNDHPAASRGRKQKPPGSCLLGRKIRVERKPEPWRIDAKRVRLSGEFVSDVPKTGSGIACPRCQTSMRREITRIVTNVNTADRQAASGR
jgi:hypothetical protein